MSGRDAYNDGILVVRREVDAFLGGAVMPPQRFLSELEHHAALLQGLVLARARVLHSLHSLHNNLHPYKG